MVKKHVLLALSLVLFTACSSKSYDTVDSQAEADKMNKNVVVADKVYFKLNSAELNKKAKDTLDLAATGLNQEANKTKTLTVEGHCDERGTVEYNMALGQKRAEAVKKYLVSKKVKANRVNVVSFGKEKPEVLGSGEEVWSKNRRAVLVENVK